MNSQSPTGAKGSVFFALESVPLIYLHIFAQLSTLKTK